MLRKVSVDTRAILALGVLEQRMTAASQSGIVEIWSALWYYWIWVRMALDFLKVSSFSLSISLELFWYSPMLSSGIT